MQQRVLWIICLVIDLTNKNKKVCLTLDCSGNVLNEPGKFRIEADSPDSQICYFNVINNEQLFNVYISKQINNSQDNDDIQFKIIHLKSKANNQETFDATQEIQSVNKQNGTGTTGSVNSGKKVRSSFSISIKPPISERESGRRKRPRFRLKQ